MCLYLKKHSTINREAFKLKQEMTNLMTSSLFKSLKVSVQLWVHNVVVCTNWIKVGLLAKVWLRFSCQEEICLRELQLQITNWQKKRFRSSWDKSSKEDNWMFLKKYCLFSKSFFQWIILQILVIGSRCNDAVIHCEQY